MMFGNLPLIAITGIWILLVWGMIMPIFSMPVARIKREFALTLLGVGSITIAIEWLTRLAMHPVSILAISAFILICGIMLYLLRRLDYYVEDLLQELFVLAVSSAGIGIVTSLWYWGLFEQVNLFALRLLIAGLPLVFFGVSWSIAKQQYSLWSAAIYCGLLLLKWITLPYWGIWTIILLMLYSTLVGYVANWMATTTYAEKVLAWNIVPAKLWSVLVLSAGALVLFF